MITANYARAITDAKIINDAEDERKRIEKEKKRQEECFEQKMSQIEIEIDEAIRAACLNKCFSTKYSTHIPKACIPRMTTLIEGIRKIGYHVDFKYSYSVLPSDRSYNTDVNLWIYWDNQ